jgi:hypothetical protein
VSISTVLVKNCDGISGASTVAVIQIRPLSPRSRNGISKRTPSVVVITCATSTSEPHPPVHDVPVGRVSVSHTASYPAVPQFQTRIS